MNVTEAIQPSASCSSLYGTSHFRAPLLVHRDASPLPTFPPLPLPVWQALDPSPEGERLAKRSELVSLNSQDSLGVAAAARKRVRGPRRVRSPFRPAPPPSPLGAYSGNVNPGWHPAQWHPTRCQTPGISVRGTSVFCHLALSSING